MSSQNILSDKASEADLFSRMESPDRETFESFKNLKVEAAFIERIFVVYKPTGLLREGLHRDPEVLTQVRITGFRADAKAGAEVDIEDLKTNEVMTVGYIPRRLFGYDVFVGVAHRQRLNWDATLLHGVIRRSMSFGILLKERSRPDYYSHGATSIETPAKFRALFPDYTLTLMKPNT